jgi:putative ubiquitin-RnfH superfamily antitoxin RatB of RatAB toxin-antitoxin module
MAATDIDRLSVEVVYASTRQVHVITLSVDRGTSIRQVIAQSGILADCPEINLEINKTGIFGTIRNPDDAVDDHCRVEIYRPLLADPKTARRLRARAGKS